MEKQNLRAVNQDQKAMSKEFSTQMRAASFKMGSILPEHNSYKPQQLERNNSGAIGLSQSHGYKPRNNAAAPLKS